MIKKKAPIKIIRREKVEYLSRDKYEKVDPLNLTRLHRVKLKIDQRIIC